MDIWAFQDMNQIAMWCIEWLEERGMAVNEVRIAHTGPARYITGDINLIIFPFADDVLCFYANIGKEKAEWDITVKWLNGTKMGAEKLVKSLLDSWVYQFVVRVRKMRKAS